MRHKAPLWMIFLVDLAAFGVALCAFAYFHHVRDFMSIGSDTSSAPETIFTKPSKTVSVTHSTQASSTGASLTTVHTDAPTAQTATVTAPLSTDVTLTGTHTSTSAAEGSSVTTVTVTTVATTQTPVDPGDFGHLHGARFLPCPEDTPVQLSDDAAIRTYLLDNSFSVSSTKGGKYIGLYRSHDVFLTVEQVTDRIVYESNNKYSPEVYYVYDAYVRNMENLFTVTVSKRDGMDALISRAQLLNNVTVLGAVNGDYYGNAKRCMVAIRNGQLWRRSDTVLGDVCVLYHDGVMETVSAADYDYDAIAVRSPYQVWCFGPALLNADGSVRTEAQYDKTAYDNNLIYNRHPRTAIGYFEPGHYALLTVDGRTEESYGMRVLQLGRIFESMGCKAAYNLDGGDSCQAYYGGQFIRQAEGREEQRELYDIVCIGEVS